MAFLCNTGQRNKRQYLSVLTWYNLFANRFGTNTSPDILRLLPDIIQTPKDTGSPRQRRFYVIKGTCHIYCALSYIKMPMSGGVWMVSGVSRGCLDGVWMVSGWCLDGVSMVSGWYFGLSGMYKYQSHISSALYFIKMGVSGLCLGVSDWCLECVWGLRRCQDVGIPNLLA